MDASIAPVAVESLAAAQAVSVQPKRIQIQHLTIDRPGIVDYLETIAADKVEIALLHALEVGIVAMQARRAQFQRREENRR